MELFEALDAFSSLSQETRLKVLKMLIEYGSEGAMAGKIAEQLKIPDNTLSFHLAHMSRASLVTSKKNGREVRYFANQNLIENLISFLNENCCVRESNNKRNKGRKC